MAFWFKMLKQLERSEKSFKSFYDIMSSRFKTEIFSEQLIDSRISKMTYQDLQINIESIASSLLMRFGTEKQHSFISMKMENSPLWVASFFGILMAGFKPFLINTQLGDDVVADLNTRIDAIAMLTDKEEGPLAINAKDLLNNKSNPMLSAWEEEFALMTSGTTGDFKIVIYDSKAIITQILTSNEIIRSNPTIKHNRKIEIKLMAFLPFYHIFGLVATLMWFLFFGRTFVFLPKYDAKTIQFTCLRFQVTHFFAVPLVFDSIANMIVSEARKKNQEKKLRKAIKLSNKLQTLFPRFGKLIACSVLFKKVRRQVLGESLRFAINGGSHIKPETAEILNGLGYSLYNGYGMTEAGIVSVELSRKAKQRLTPSLGKIFSCFDYKFDSNNVLYLKSDSLYKAALIDGKIVNREEEWFQTRDIFTEDRHKKMYLIGRVDDLIIGANGENISPVPIEQKLTLKGLESFCVIGITNEAQNDELSLIVKFPDQTTETNKTLLLADVFAQVDELPSLERPLHIYVATDPMPQSLGKVQRRLLKSKIQSGEFAMVPASRQTKSYLTEIGNQHFKEILETVKKLFAEVMHIPVSKVQDETHFMLDLGGSSLEYYTLIHELQETFHIDFKFGIDELYLTPVQFANNLAKK